MNNYGVGVIGCGEVWRKYHRHAFEGSNRFYCARAFDSVVERAEKVTQATGAGRPLGGGSLLIR